MKNAVFLGLSLLMSACTSLGRLSTDATLESNQESIFILGVAPENYRIFVFPGSIEDGRFRQNPFRPAAVYGAAENGFVVGKASAGDTVAITNVRVVKDKDSILGADFQPCRDAKTMTFSIPGGKELYLGHVEYEFVGEKLMIKYGQDVNSAKKYLDENYPKLRGRLESWEYQLLPTTKSCISSIPVYLPRMR